MGRHIRAAMVVVLLSDPLLFATARAEDAASAESCSAQHSADLLGRWNIKRWETPGYMKYRGNLVIKSQTSPTDFEGVLTVYCRMGWRTACDAAIVESMAITVSGATVVMRATTVKGARSWSPDTFTLSICGQTMSGMNKDAAGYTRGPIVLVKD